MKTKFNYCSYTIKDNIKEVADSVPPSLFLQGPKWYVEANNWLQCVAQEYSLPLEIICAICSSLSPTCSWAMNKKFLINYLQGQNKHTERQIEKCDNLLLLSAKFTKDELEHIIGGRKTIHFFNCLLNPETSEHCCLDRHALMISGMELQSLKDNQYDFLLECWLSVAEEYKLKPITLQSVTWQYWRSCKFSHESYG